MQHVHGVGILLANKLARLIIAHWLLYKNRVGLNERHLGGGYWDCMCIGTQHPHIKEASLASHDGLSPKGLQIGNWGGGLQHD